MIKTPLSPQALTFLFRKRDTHQTKAVPLNIVKDYFQVLKRKKYSKLFNLKFFNFQYLKLSSF